MQQQMLLARQLEEQRAAQQLHDSLLMQQILARQQQREDQVYGMQQLGMSGSGFLGSQLGYGRSMYDDPSMLQYSGGLSLAQQMRDAGLAGARQQQLQGADQQEEMRRAVLLGGASNGATGEGAGQYDDDSEDEKPREVSEND
jgi:hypothetical protein